MHTLNRGDLFKPVDSGEKLLVNFSLTFFYPMTHTIFGRLLLAGILSVPAAIATGAFTGRIISAETGELLAASVVVTDRNGEAVEIQGNHAHVEYLGKKWCYVDETFDLDVESSGGLSVSIRRGLETLPLENVPLQGKEQTFKLRRWTDMAGHGWMNGDTHVHFLPLDQCHWQMRAEDLEVLNLLTSDFTNDVEKFTGELDPVSTPGHWVYVGQEFRDWQQGHINLLRLRKLVEPVEPFGGIFREWSYRTFTVASAAREAKAQGAAVTWAHFGDIPGTESPIDFALGLIDAVDLITQSDPFKVPYHWPPWKMEPPVHLPELPALSGMELYYQYLNAGFRIPLAAGTDKMSERIPVGSSRLYVKVDGPQDFDAWVDGVKAGNGFITNGPMLTFSVDDHASGEVIEFNEAKQVVARGTARSMHPFSRLQIVVNGRVVAEVRNPTQNADGIYEASINFPIGLKESAWIASRVAATPGLDEPILPRRMTVFAHANPIYFLKDGQRVRMQESIDYLTLYLQYTRHWYRTAANFENPAEKRKALLEAEQAMNVYQGL